MRHLDRPPAARPAPTTRTCRAALVAAVALAVLAVLPAVTAQVPEAREIDTRVLSDGTDNGDYGADGNLDEGGLDILALDMYEGTLPGSTQPALVFRAIVQGGDDSKSPHEIAFDFKVGGQALRYTLISTDLATWGSGDFEVVRGPVQAGDGGSQAIEGIVSHDTLGAASGAALTQITVTSSADGSKADEMPGSWYYSGQEVPLLPGAEEGDPGTYTLGGTPDWFTLESETDLIEASLAGTTLNLSVQSTLSSLEQRITFDVETPAGTNATVEPTMVPIGPGASRTVSLTVTGIAAGDLKVRATSDLGLTRFLSFPLGGNVTVGNGAGVAGPLLAQGESYQYRFTTPAVFEFHCHPHPWMMGKVNIVEDDPTDGPKSHVVRIVEHDHGDPDSFAFSPAEITVQVNDTVIWINEGLQEHNVHGDTGLGDGHDHDHDHDHGEPEEDAAGLPLTAALLLLAFVASRRRG